MVSMTMAGMMAVQVETNDGTNAASPHVPVPVPDPLVEALNALPNGWQDNPVEALVSLVTDNAELALPLAVQMAQASIESGDCETALGLLDAVIGGVEADGDDPASLHKNTGAEPLAFRNPFETALYSHMNGPDRPVHPVPVEMFGAYYLRGWLSFGTGLYEKAEQSLRTAAALNPTCCEPLFELAEIAKTRGDLDAFQTLTNRALAVAYTSGDLGRAYRSLAYLHAERADYDLALALCFYSMVYDPGSGAAWSELAFIRERTGKPLSEPSTDEIRSTLTANGIQLGASDAVMTVAASLAQDALASRQYEDALLACHILADVSRG